MEGCHGLSYNHGLFTQCRNKCDNSHYCSKCADEADKNAKSVPDNGCIEDRLKVGLYEFKDFEALSTCRENSLITAFFSSLASE